MGLLDVDPFAMKTLRKLATGEDTTSDRNFKPGSVADAKRNQDYANKRLSKTHPKTTLSSPMTPQGPPAKSPDPSAKPPESRGKIQNND